MDDLLNQGIELEYALFSGLSEVDFTRFPKTGFIRGNIRDLAAFAEYAAVPEEDAVQRAVAILEQGVQDAAAILKQASEQSEDTQNAITEHLKQAYSDQTLRMASTILINALTFHQNLAGQHGVRNLDQIFNRRRINPKQCSGRMAEDSRRQLLVHIQHRHRPAAIHQPTEFGSGSAASDAKHRR